MISAGVGLQRQRFGAQQMIPWPSKRNAMAAAASDMATAAERRLEDQALFIFRRVAEAYWRLWTIHEVRAIETEQRALLSALAEAARTRLALGKTSLADVTQIDLEVARRDDALRGLDEREISARAMLRQVIGAPADMHLPISAPTPLAVVPAEPADALRAAARAHPRIRALVFMAQASEHAASAAGAERMPDFMLGIDYETGLMPDATGSGDNHIMVSVGMTVPLWRGTYGAAENRARAEAAAFRARQHEAENMAEAELDAALAEVRDAARRIALYETTLIPQAEIVYAAVTGNYQTGAAQLASTLLAQKSLLELHTLLVEARVDHAQAWSRLQEIVGRPVAAQPLNREVTNE
jgi:outer membrane protein TolC